MSRLEELEKQSEAQKTALAKLEKENEAQKQALSESQTELQAWKDFHADGPGPWTVRTLFFTVEFDLMVILGVRVPSVSQVPLEPSCPFSSDQLRRERRLAMGRRRKHSRPSQRPKTQA